MLAPSLARLPPPARCASPVPGPARLSPQTLKCPAVRCRSCELALVHGFSLQEWSRTPTQTTGGITAVEWALQHVPILPPTSFPPAPTPRDVLPVCEQDKKNPKNIRLASIICICPLTCSSWFAGNTPKGLSALTSHSSSCWLGAQDPLHTSVPSSFLAGLMAVSTSQTFC